MYKNRYIFIVFLVIFSLFFISFGYSSESTVNRLESTDVKIDEMDRSWFSVLTGSPVTEPVKTGYGFITVLDYKFLACYSKNGNLLWQTNIGSKILYTTITDNDFIYVINQKNQLVLLNPSGMILWTKNLDYEPAGNPVQGIDGRIFVKGHNFVSCFGINGTTKWQLNTEDLMSEDIQILNDGSLLVFCKRVSNGKTCGLRISPFGTLLEEIVFQGKIVNSFSTSKGVILIFSSNETGMASINFSSKEEHGLIISKWINKNLLCNEKTKTIQKNDSKITLFTPGKALYTVNLESGLIEKQFSLSEFPLEITAIDYIDNKYSVLCQNQLFLLNNSGKKIKSYTLPSKTGKYKWDYCLFLDTGYIVFSSKDWTINAFKILSTSKSKDTLLQSSSKSNVSTYKEYIKNFDYKPEAKEFSSSVYKVIKNGNYESAEISISNSLIAAFNTYYEQKTTGGVTKDTVNLIQIKYSMPEVENLIQMLPAMESEYFQLKIAQLLSIETDKTIIVKLLKCIAESGFDPTGDILFQIEMLVKRTNPKDKLILENAVNAVYEICKVMGRPALYAKGKDILTGMFYPQYDEATKKAVRNTMQKLADLKM